MQKITKEKQHADKKGVKIGRHERLCKTTQQQENRKLNPRGGGGGALDPCLGIGVSLEV